MSDNPVLVLGLSCSEKFYLGGISLNESILTEIGLCDAIQVGLELLIFYF